MAVIDGTSTTEAGLQLRKTVDVDAVRAGLDSVTEAIGLGHPSASMWLALENWAGTVTVDTRVIMTAFQTADDEADILATYGTLLTASPQGTLTDTRFADSAERITRRDIERISHVAAGIKWAIGSSVEVATDATRLKRIALVGVKALNGLSF